MRKLLRTLTITLLAASLSAQQPAVSIRNGTADPATCKPGSTNIFYRSDTAALKVCSAANTWTALGSGVATVANGGTGQSSAPDDNILIGNGTGYNLKAISDCVDTGGNHLNYTASTNSISCGTSGGGGAFVALDGSTIGATSNVQKFTAGVQVGDLTTTAGTVDFGNGTNTTLLRLRNDDTTHTAGTGRPIKIVLSGNIGLGGLTWTWRATSGTTAYLGDALSAFASTTSAGLAGVISDESGSGSLLFGTAPTVSDLITSGSTPAVSNTTANSCGTSAASIVGNNTTGVITVGATAGTNCTITFTVAATSRRQCTVTNETTANLSRSTYLTTTTSTVEGTFAAGDQISYVCAVY